MVKRWMCDPESTHQHPEGQYVDLIDFVYVETKIAALSSEVERLKQYIRGDGNTLIDELNQTVDALRAQLADYKQTFDLIHQAEIRGVEMFVKAHPEYAEQLKHPSTDRLICWLMDRLSLYRRAVEPVRECLMEEDPTGEGLRDAVKQMIRILGEAGNE